LCEHYVFSNFLKSARGAEEQITSGKLFQTEVAAVEKTTTMMTRLVNEMTSAVDDVDGTVVSICLHHVMHSHIHRRTDNP